MERSRDIEARIRRFRQLHEQNPGARYFAPLADLLRMDGRYEEALAVLGPGLAEHGDYLAGLVIQGRTLVEMGRRREGLAVLQRVLDQDAQNVVALEYLAETALEDGDWDPAIRHLETLCGVLEDEGGWSDLLAQARTQAAAVREAEADGDSPETETGIETGSDPSFDTMTLVEIYLAQGYRERALAALRRMLPGAGDGRERIERRIASIEAGGDPAEKGAASRLPRDERSAAAARPAPSGAREWDRAQRREAERRQFEEWLEKIRFNGGHGE